MLTFLEHTDKKSGEYEPIRFVFGKKSMFTMKHIKEDIDITSHVAKLDTHLKAHYHKFDGEDKANIHSYTDDSEKVNKHLHTTQGNHTHHNRFIKSFDKTLTKHTTPHDLHVYSGIHPEHDLTKIGHTQGAHDDKPIKTIHHGYTSTSIHRGVAKSFARVTHSNIEDNDRVHHEEQHRHLMHIHVPEGHHGAYVEHHSRADRGEHEFILPRGSKFHVHPTPTTETHKTRVKDEHTGKVYKTTTHYHTWHAVIQKD